MESLTHPLPIFSAERSSHHLTNDALVFQLLNALAEKPQSSATQELRAKILAILNNEYVVLIEEHTELIRQKRTSLEIARWLGEKLNIESWKAGTFHGEYRGLCTPTPEEMMRLNAFSSVRNVPASAIVNNGGSDNHPQFFLINGYSPTALFGPENVKKMDERIDQIDRDWNAMGEDFAAKEQYLKDKVGLDIKGDWKKLTGIRTKKGFFIGPAVYVCGSQSGRHRNNRMIFLDNIGSLVKFDSASDASLCLLK